MSKNIIRKINAGEIKSLQEVKKLLVKEYKIKWGKRVPRVNHEFFEINYRPYNYSHITTRLAFSEICLIDRLESVSGHHIVSIIKNTYTNFYAYSRKRTNYTEVIYS